MQCSATSTIAESKDGGPGRGGLRYAVGATQWAPCNGFDHPIRNACMTAEKDGGPGRGRSRYAVASTVLSQIHVRDFKKMVGLEGVDRATQ